MCLLEQLHFGSSNQSSTVHLDQKTRFDFPLSGSLSNETISMSRTIILSFARIPIHFIQKGVSPLIHSKTVTSSSRWVIINQHERIPYTNHTSSTLHYRRHHILSNNIHTLCLVRNNPIIVILERKNRLPIKSKSHCPPDSRTCFRISVPS